MTRARWAIPHAGGSNRRAGRTEERAPGWDTLRVRPHPKKEPWRLRRQGTNEIGIRIALGATRVDILRLIMLEGLRLVLLGGAIGLVTALSTAHVLRSLLFEVGPYDPMSFVCVAVLYYWHLLPSQRFVCLPCARCASSPWLR
jgi:FtsX-like permease family protein